MVKISLYLSLSLVLGLAGCASTVKNSVNSKGFYLSINDEIIKNGKSEIIIPKASFTLEFDAYPYDFQDGVTNAIQIAATHNKSLLNHFEEGSINNQNPFYSTSGTGIAGWPDKPYDCLYTNESGHHYIYYVSETDRRADLVRRHKNGKVRLSWTIDCISMNKNTIPMSEVDLEEIYLMIHIDQNHNDQIDKKEYSMITLKLSN